MTNIKTQGKCIDRLISSIEKKLGSQEAEKLKNTAIEIVQNCVKVYSDNFGSGDVGENGTGLVSQIYKGEKSIPDGTTGLIYGRVQSGKTNTTIASLALAYENNFRCFIVLTSDNTWLGEQTANRFNNNVKSGPVFFSWESWKKDPKSFAETKLKRYINDTGVVLVSTKNIHHLENLLKVLKYANVKTVPALIFDDEADNASLNTNESKQAKQGKHDIPDSRIFEKIGKIREAIPNHIYIQITATPQSLLLQSLDHPCKPVFCAALPEPGSDYMGGELFFAENSSYCCAIKSEEIEELKNQSGEINPGNKYIAPEGLKLALCCFFLGAMYKMKVTDNEDTKYSFLAHICHKKDIHEVLENIINQFVMDLDKAIRDKSSATEKQKALKLLNKAYDELKKTADDLPPLNELIEDLKDELRRAIPKIINANNPDKEPNYNSGLNILIGGNRLGRGVTIEGLMVTYYGRDAKRKMMDTVHQHARMYGYRSSLKNVTRLFAPEHILDSFRAIHEADEGMRQAIGDDIHNIKIQPVWVGDQLQPTHANVLNPSVIDSFMPGQQVFPRDPLWKAVDVKKHTEKLNSLLADYNKNDDQDYEVSIDFLAEILQEMPSRYCPNHKWEDQRVQQVIKAIKSRGINSGILYVRRGKEGLGLDLTNKERPLIGSSGFAQSKWISQPKKLHPNLPILVVMYQKGKKEKGWDNQPLYLPTLIIPQHKFVFMFNYSKSEITEDE